MSFIDRIKALIQNFKNRNIPKLEEGKNIEPYTHSSSNRNDFINSVRVPQSVNLVQNKEDRRSSISQSTLKRRYSGTRNQKLNAHNKSKQPNFKLRIGAIAASLALAASCIAACTHKSYESMTLPQLQECLSDVDISNDELLNITTALENDGKDMLKGKIANTFDINSDNKDDYIKLIGGNEDAPTSITILGETYRSTQGIGVIDEDRANILSNGTASVVNSIARLQDKSRPVNPTQLKRYIEQLKTLEESEITNSSNTYVGNVLSADPEHESLLVQYSIADYKQNDIDMFQANAENDGFEIDD